MTVSFYLQGGIGNLMFQIAAAESIAKRQDATLCYLNAHELIPHLEGVCDWTRHAKEYLSIFPNFDMFKNQDCVYDIVRNVNVPFRYTDITLENWCNYIGYFQSEMNFLSREFILDLFTPSKAIQERLATYIPILEGNTCSIHVRRGNYLDLPEHHPVLPIGYYHQAMRTLSPFKIEHYLVFSNDIEWCKKNFVGDEYIFVHDVDYVEMFLMAQCKHHIISNSSFAWWGAYLGNYDSVIIAPKMWFGSKFPFDHADDIVPLRWIKL